MIKVENIIFHDTLVAPMIEGTRNALESWDSSDSEFNEDGLLLYLGANDEKLLTRLARKGGSEAKFRRGLFVTMTITAPLYFWKQFDTYKVSTVKLSCSTMHRIHARKLTADDFSWESLRVIGKKACDEDINTTDAFIKTIDSINELRELYLTTGEKSYWNSMIEMLPSSYNQKATVLLNYETLSHMHKDRHNHKLHEWRSFCMLIETLPFADKFIFEPDDKEADRMLAQLPDNKLVEVVVKKGQ